MATIRSRKRKDGTIGYTAQIRLFRDGVQVYQEAQTFDRKAAAQAWARRRESELAVPGAIERAGRMGVTLGDMITRYLDEHRQDMDIGRTKRATLEAVARTPFGQLLEQEITAQVIVDYARWRMSPEGGQVKAQTVGNDLAHIGAVLAIARVAWGYAVDRSAITDARLVLRRLGHGLKNAERERRPTPDELDRLLKYFQGILDYRPASINMLKVVGFALYSTRRQAEITRILWDDLDPPNQRILVRDMKNPGQKIGNHVWCHLPDEAWQILHSMPRVAAEIFPYGEQSISASFARACKFCGIDGLTFHDLRHEGVSRLFEMDWDIPRVASVSGHRNWNSMRRYTHLKGRGDPYAGWAWLPVIIASPVRISLSRPLPSG